MNTMKPEMLESLIISHRPKMAELDLISLANTMGSELLEWDFGKVMTMKFVRDHKNYLFSDEKVPFHWDGAFFREPKWLLFYCTQSSGTGGRTLFSNTELLANELSEKEKDALSKTFLHFKTEKLAHYGGKIRVQALQKHPVRGTDILRIAEKVESEKNPVELEIEGDAGLVEELQKKLYEEKYCYAHTWKAGDLLIADNFSLLHGREALKDNLNREFKRIQIM